MEVYFELLVLLNFLVDLLLLVGTERLAGFVPQWRRLLLSAGLGGLYGGCCVLPEVAFLSGTVWRGVFLILMGLMAFGWGQGSLRRCVLFVLLSMALGGLAYGIRGGFWGITAGAALLCLLCILGFRGKTEFASYIPVEICKDGKRIRLTALRDTGNTLRDPLTGERVLVVGADTAAALSGFSARELRTPVQTLAQASRPDLRLIPYHAVGKPDGMLLGLKCDEVRIGGRSKGTLVALAPEQVGSGDVFQALTGGV